MKPCDGVVKESFRLQKINTLCYDHRISRRTHGDSYRYVITLHQHQVEPQHLNVWPQLGWVKLWSRRLWLQLGWVKLWCLVYIWPQLGWVKHRTSHQTTRCRPSRRISFLRWWKQRRDEHFGILKVAGAIKQLLSAGVWGLHSDPH